MSNVDINVSSLRQATGWGKMALHFLIIRSDNT